MNQNGNDDEHGWNLSDRSKARINGTAIVEVIEDGDNINPYAEPEGETPPIAICSDCKHVFKRSLFVKLVSLGISSSLCTHPRCDRGKRHPVSGRKLSPFFRYNECDSWNSLGQCEMFEARAW